MSDIFDLDTEYVCGSYARFPLEIERGEGSRLYSSNGREYIDFTSGIGVCSIGHGNPQWVEAVTGQAKALAHVSNLYYTKPCVTLAERIIKLSGLKKVFFANSGAEANEGAIKLARKYSFDKYGKSRDKVITLLNSFHGRTITTLSATGQDSFHNYFFPFTEGFKHVVANDIEAFRSVVADEDVCAIMLESIQGEGGVIPLDASYIEHVYKFCADKDVLLIFDEVQTGVGRTGKMFGYEHFNVMPDIVTVAKGLGGGLPIGAVITGEKCMSTFTPGTHGSTFGGNPVCSMAAHAVLDIINDELLKQVGEKGLYIKNRLLAENLKIVKEIRGKGLMLGISVDADPKQLCTKALERGLLCLTAGKSSLRLLPPLTIQYADIDSGLKILIDILNEGC